MSFAFWKENTSPKSGKAEKPKKETTTNETEKKKPEATSPLCGYGGSGDACRKREIEKQTEM